MGRTRGIRHHDAGRLAREIERADIDAERRRLVKEELDAARERQDDLKSQIARCRDLLQQSRQWVQFEENAFREALSCSLELAGASPLRRTPSDDGGDLWTFPVLDGQIHADPSWAGTLDSLRPRRRHQKLTEWRKEEPPRPVVFEDPGVLTDDTVHLHLEQRVTQRLLARFRSQGFVHHDLSRACLAQSADSIPRVVLLGRLTLYGRRAERLHEEIVAAAARWVEPGRRDAPARRLRARNGETLCPDFAVREREPEQDGSAWQLLVRTIGTGQDFDRVTADAGRLEASPHSRLERLLRAKNVPAGLLFNGRLLRLVSAPRGESSGWMDFRVADMLLPAGRPICTALRQLLNERRLLALPRNQRLAALLADSRKYQNEVSEKLAVQVLHALDVEHIGAVYETMMGFRLERAEGRSAAIKAAKKHGAPATVNLEALLEERPGRRLRWFGERTDRKLTGAAVKALRDAATLDDLHAALEKAIDRDATPDLVRAGDLILQPSEERRRSGSHYTPRELTEPIVRDTLESILDRLRREAAPPGPSARGPSGSHPPQAESVAGASTTGAEPPPAPRPEQVLDLKICDPAMGSGAFLVEACRQLADALVDSWHVHDAVPTIPPDEDETVHARRLVARNCLYGVDRNPVAVDLAKLSLWLVTLARDHPLTFLDHALREGDSLVGLNLEQIQSFHWKGGKKRFQAGIETTWIREQVGHALRLRRDIQNADDETPDRELRERLREADAGLARVKRHGDLALAAFFEGKKSKEREELRRRFAAELQFGSKATLGAAIRRGHEAADLLVSDAGLGDGRPPDPASGDSLAERGDGLSASGTTISHIAWLEELRNADPPLAPFHWQAEYPEVFLLGERESPGFDAIVGNPPFAGKNTTRNANVPGYPDWLKQLHEESHGNADLVAHFFRRAFDLLRQGGAFGLIATNTIAQGDTRATGLR